MKIMNNVAAICMLALSIVSCKPEVEQINRAKADKIMADYIDREITYKEYRLYFYSDTLSEVVKVVDWSLDTMTGVNEFVYFLDEIPIASWAHACRYIWISKKDGSYRVYHRTSLPEDWVDKWILIEDRAVWDAKKGNVQ